MGRRGGGGGGSPRRCATNILLISWPLPLHLLTRTGLRLVQGAFEYFEREATSEPDSSMHEVLLGSCIHFKKWDLAEKVLQLLASRNHTWGVRVWCLVMRMKVICLAEDISCCFLSSGERAAQCVHCRVTHEAEG